MDQRSEIQFTQTTSKARIFFNAKPLLLAGYKILLTNFFDSKKIDFDIHSRKL